jgi:hypothetical protein
MQVEPAAGGVLSPLQPPELTSVDALRDKCGVRTVTIARLGGRRRGRSPRPWRADGWWRANAAARIGREADNIRHRAREVLGVSVRSAGPVFSAPDVVLLEVPLHTAIVWSNQVAGRRVKVMKTVDRLVAVLILLLGIIHVGVAPVFRGGYDGAGMWFLSGGLMLIFLGLLNLVRAGSPGAAARKAAVGANILALAFVSGLVPLASLRQNPQVPFSILVIAAATLFSLLRRERG